MYELFKFLGKKGDTNEVLDDFKASIRSFTYDISFEALLDDHQK